MVGVLQSTSHKGESGWLKFAFLLCATSVFVSCVKPMTTENTEVAQRNQIGTLLKGDPYEKIHPQQRNYRLADTHLPFSYSYRGSSPNFDLRGEICLRQSRSENRLSRSILHDDQRT